MANGVSVFGGFQAAEPSWSRNPVCATRILAQDERGVLFDAAVEAPTVLDGFIIAAGDMPNNAAVTIDGSTGAVLSNNQIDGGRGTRSFGVQVLGTTRPATPRLLANTIGGGSGNELAVGVRSWRSAPLIRGSCANTDADRCVSDGCSGRLGSIRGHARGSFGARTIGISLEDSPARR